VSLKNNNPDFNLEYWSYNNEFVRNQGLNSATNTILKRPENGEQLMMFREGTTTPPVDIPGTVVYIASCNLDLPDIFPFASRAAVDFSANMVTSTLGNFTEFNALLGDAFPNPASTSVTISIFTPELVDKEFVLSIFDLSGKKVVAQTTIKERGKTNIEVSLSNLHAGVYGYGLSENGKTLSIRKLVVIK